MTLSAAVITFVVCSLIVVVAGTALARCGDAIAELTGFGRLLVGSILIAGATSLPELVVDITAIRNHMPDLAVGDLLGSSLMNLLILAGLDAWYHSARRAFSRESIGHALSAMAGILTTSLVIFGIAGGARFGRFSLLDISPILWFVGAAYLFSVRLIFHDQQLARLSQKEVLAAEPQPDAGMTLRTAVIGFSMAALVIIIVGPFLSTSAGVIADQSGLGRTFVGTTLVALTTSLPELVASIVAIRMGAFDLAAGNIFGSNAFNMLLLLPLDALHPGSLIAAISPDHIVTGAAMIAVTSIAVIGQLYGESKRRRILDPDSTLVILLIITALYVLYVLGQTHE
ncbi:MAG TPA: hypothetical protein VFG20_10715 [Planctomycetaceae bacterium]|nr:hypothetical protein [Planctomycetaceae bacterium]